MLTLSHRIDDERKDNEPEEYHVEFLESREDSTESLQPTKQSFGNLGLPMSLVASMARCTGLDAHTQGTQGARPDPRYLRR